MLDNVVRPPKCRQPRLKAHACDTILTMRRLRIFAGAESRHCNATYFFQRFLLAFKAARWRIADGRYTDTRQPHATTACCAATHAGFIRPHAQEHQLYLILHSRRESAAIDDSCLLSFIERGSTSSKALVHMTFSLR